MAMFRTHLAVATVASALASAALLGGGIVSPGEAAALWAVGTAGGIMPDIDADKSEAVETIFTGLGLILALAIMVYFAGRRSTLELWIFGSLTYVAVRYYVLRAFYKYSHHRGIFHSVLAGVFFWFVATAISHHILHLSAQLSWGAGAFIFFGFIIHLTLDEIYSVDLENHDLKKSFGTALKLVDYHNLKTSSLMGIAALVFFIATPPTTLGTFARIVFSAHTYHSIFSTFFP
jgi:hypothetical protein